MSYLATQPRGGGEQTRPSALLSSQLGVRLYPLSTLRPVSPDFTLQTVALHHFIRPRALSDGLPGNDGSSHTHTHSQRCHFPVM